MKLKYPENEYEAEIEVKKSKFIGLVLPHNDLKNSLRRLRDEHPKARHFVYALRYLNEFKQIVEDQSDDGEPKNSAGKPILNVMRGEDIINTAIVVIRYFGGTKLGVGGLIRAYGKAAQQVIEKANWLPLRDMLQNENIIAVQMFSKFEHTLNKYHGSLESKEFLGEEVRVKYSLEEEQMEIFLKELEGYLN